MPASGASIRHDNPRRHAAQGGMETAASGKRPRACPCPTAHAQIQRTRRSSPRAQTPLELPEVRLHLARLCLVPLQQLRASRQDIFCDFVSSWPTLSHPRWLLTLLTPQSSWEPAAPWMCQLHPLLLSPLSSALKWPRVILLLTSPTPHGLYLYHLPHEASRADSSPLIWVILQLLTYSFAVLRISG